MSENSDTLNDLQILSTNVNWSVFRGPDKLSVQLGIYPTRFYQLLFLKKQLLKNIFYPTCIFKIANL